MKKNTKKKLPQKSNKETTQTIRQESWLRRMLKKISSVQVISVLVAIILGAITLFVQCNRDKKQDEIAILENRAKHHEDLILLMDGFELVSKTYNIDEVIPSGLRIISSKVEIHNRGTLDAENLVLNVFCDKMNIISLIGGPGSTDFLQENGKWGKLDYKNFYPNMYAGSGVFLSLDTPLNNEDQHTFGFACTCSHKINPIDARFESTVFRLKDFEDYHKNITSKYSDSYEYWKQKDFIFVHSAKGEQLDCKVYQVVANNGDIQFVEKVRKQSI